VNRKVIVPGDRSSTSPIIHLHGIPLQARAAIRSKRS